MGLDVEEVEDMDGVEERLLGMSTGLCGTSSDGPSEAGEFGDTSCEIFCSLGGGVSSLPP